ncbi:hypothetical protein [Roseateles sp. LYH14W]|uniref:Uncharacterized protein n=1 Tax=Pelomonas parva TaxID=3299032 RepID=A0ABW7FAC5_9BURK
MYAMEDSAATSEAISLLRQHAKDLWAMSAQEQKSVVDHFSRYSSLLTDCERAADEFRGRKPEKQSFSYAGNQYHRAFLTGIQSNERLAESIRSLKTFFVLTYERRGASLGISSSRYLKGLTPTPPTEKSLLPPVKEDPQLNDKIKALETTINRELRTRAKRIGASVEDYAFLVNAETQETLSKEGLLNFPDHWAKLIPAIKRIEASEKVKLHPYFGPK